MRPDLAACDCIVSNHFFDRKVTAAAAVYKESSEELCAIEVSGSTAMLNVALRLSLQLPQELAILS